MTDRPSDGSLAALKAAADRGLARLRLEQIKAAELSNRSILEEASLPRRQRERDALLRDLIPRLEKIIRIIEGADYLTTQQRKMLFLQLNGADLIPSDLVLD